MELKIDQIIEMYSALLQLDGANKSVKNGESEVIIKEPYDFPGKTRWNLGKNITVLKRYSDKFNENKDNFIKLISGGKNKIDPKNSEQMVEFQTQLNAELQKMETVDGLLKIKLSDLKLDQNRIGSTILSALEPLIEE